MTRVPPADRSVPSPSIPLPAWVFLLASCFGHEKGPQLKKSPCSDKGGRARGRICRVLDLTSALVGPGCQHKTPQTGQLKPQTFLSHSSQPQTFLSHSSRGWKPEVRETAWSVPSEGSPGLQSAACPKPRGWVPAHPPVTALPEALRTPLHSSRDPTSPCFCVLGLSQEGCLLSPIVVGLSTLAHPKFQLFHAC